MSNTTIDQGRKWHMPVVPESYCRDPLTSQEKRALSLFVQYRATTNSFAQQAKRDLQRLQAPIFDTFVLRVNRADSKKYGEFRSLLYLEMDKRGTSFWEWSKEEWKEIICLTNHEYFEKYHTFGYRASLMDIAYLLCGFTDLREVDQKRDCVHTAQAVFGKETIQQAMDKVATVLENQGYAGSRTARSGIRQVLCILFLLNRNPHLDDLSYELLQEANRKPYSFSAPHHFNKVCIALQQLGIITKPIKGKVIARIEDSDTAGVPGEWVMWCRAWANRYPKLTECFRYYYTCGLNVGRWLAETHPGVISPEQWDEDLALEYVRYVCTEAKVGDYASTTGIRRLTLSKHRGRPLAPRTMNDKLSAMSRIFTDFQMHPHSIDGAPARKIELPFIPRETFVLPPSIRKLIQPDPRDIDEVIWCKLTYAAATLTEDDVASTGYSLTYYQAAALLWITSARRSNEIVRLQLGCIRRDWDPEMLDEYGTPLPSQNAQLCYLHVPSNKTKGRYWIPIPRYTADAIEAWEQERPSQPSLIDSKDGSHVHFLFCYRGKRIGRQFINASLIPLLCKRAGVPERDARGTITSHRARSTIATMLRRNGLSLDDISQFLGHASPTMVRAYARTDPFRFGREMNRANDLMRIVEGIIDTRAAKAGKPNVFFFLGRGADGKPRFCGNPAWDKCKHRLACLKCPMYVGADQASRLAERLETRDELFKFQSQVKMLPQEKAAVEGDIEMLTSLIEADADVPPPELPSDQFCFNTPSSEEHDLSPDQENQADLVTFGKELAALRKELAVVEQRSDGRNAHVRSLKKRIAALSEKMASLDQIAVLTQASLEL